RQPIAYADTAQVLKHLPPALRAEGAATLEKPPTRVKAQMALVEDIAASCHAPAFNVQYGPNGVQWCSHEMLTAIAEASALTGRQVHMHLLEPRYQREWADRHYPQGMVRYLADIGLLSP